MIAKAQHAPGVFAGIDNDAYHASHGLSNSDMTLIARAPAMYFARKLDPRRPEQLRRAGQLEGTLAHCAILEPNEFCRRYRIGPDVSAATKAWKEAAERAESDGCELIKPGQHDTAMRQADSVRELPRVREFLGSGRAELSAWAIDPETSVLKKCRPDFTHEIGTSEAILLDVKTYSDASPDEFARQIARKAYYRQDAHYRDTYSQASGRTVREFIFVAVEDEWPFLAKAVSIDEMALEYGRCEVARLTAIYAECLKTNIWPGYGDDTAVVSLPSWVFPKQESEEVEVEYV